MHACDYTRVSRSPSHVSSSRLAARRRRFFRFPPRAPVLFLSRHRRHLTRRRARFPLYLFLIHRAARVRLDDARSTRLLVSRARLLASIHRLAKRDVRDAAGDDDEEDDGEAEPERDQGIIGRRVRRDVHLDCALAVERARARRTRRRARAMTMRYPRRSGRDDDARRRWTRCRRSVGRPSRRRDARARGRGRARAVGADAHGVDV